MKTDRLMERPQPVDQKKIMGVVISGLAPARRRKTKHARRGTFFQLRLMDFYDAGIRAIAKCQGLSHRQVFDSALRLWMKQQETSFGLDVITASRLSNREIRAIAAKIKLARAACRVGGNEDCN